MTRARELREREVGIPADRSAGAYTRGLPVRTESCSRIKSHVSTSTVNSRVSPQHEPNLPQAQLGLHAERVDDPSVLGALDGICAAVLRGLGAAVLRGLGAAVLRGLGAAVLRGLGAALPRGLGAALPRGRHSFRPSGLAAVKVTSNSWFFRQYTISFCDAIDSST